MEVGCPAHGLLNLADGLGDSTSRGVVLTTEASGLSPRENRIHRNEELFREVNARIAELQDRLILAGEPLPLICECADPGCATVIVVEQDTFRAVHEKPGRFLVAPGHRSDDEAVVGRGAGYLIVDKEQ